MTDSRRRVDDFSLPAGNSRRRRRLKTPGALAPGFTGVGGAMSAGGARPAPTEPKARLGQPPTSTRRVYTDALLASTTSPVAHLESRQFMIARL